MRVFITLGDVLNRCEDWELFCQEQGYSEYCVAEGGSEIEIELSEEEIKKYGIL